MLGNVLFYTFSTILCISAILSIINRNSVHAVLYLVVMFFASAWVMLLLNAEFLALLLIIVYVGAVAVLFLFVVMMLGTYYTNPSSEWQGVSSLIIASLIFLQIFSILTLKHAQKNIISNIPIPDISHSLYITNFINFQIAGIILLIGMVAVIVLRDNKNSRTTLPQNINISSANCITIEYPHIKEGIKL